MHRSLGFMGLFPVDSHKPVSITTSPSVPFQLALQIISICELPDICSHGCLKFTVIKLGRRCVSNTFIFPATLALSGGLQSLLLASMHKAIIWVVLLNWPSVKNNGQIDRGSDGTMDSVACNSRYLLSCKRYWDERWGCKLIILCIRVVLAWVIINVMASIIKTLAA